MFLIYQLDDNETERDENGETPQERAYREYQEDKADDRGNDL